MIDAALLRSAVEQHKKMRETLAGDFRKAKKGKAFDTAIGKLITGLKQEETSL